MKVVSWSSLGNGHGKPILSVEIIDTFFYEEKESTINNIRYIVRFKIEHQKHAFSSYIYNQL